MIFLKDTHNLQNHNAKDSKLKKGNFSVYKGLFMAILSGVFYSSAAVIVKQMTNLHPGQVVAYRFIAVFAFSFPQAVKCEENLLGPKNLRVFLLLRGIFGATKTFLDFIVFRYLPLGEGSVIIFSVPIFVTVAARIFLKEPCGIFQSLTVVTTVVGIVFSTKIPQKLAGNSVVYTNEYIYGLLSAVGSLFFSTGRFILMRKVKSVHHSVIMFNFGWVAVVETVILTVIFGNFQLHNCGLQGLYIIILGLLGYLGQTLLTMALQCELAGPVSTMRAATDIIICFMWQILIFHDIPDFYSSLGAVLVGVSVIFVGLMKWISSLSNESQYRIKLGWILK